jgi:4-amino-4-deoxy-L-arabinose transferase-like glycosyltransferase
LIAHIFAFEHFEEIILSIRIFTAVVTSLNVLLLYRVTKNRYGNNVGIIASLLFLMSFVVMRYGGRFNLEPFALLFILLSIYFINRRPMVSALSAGTSFAVRTTSLVYIPFYILYQIRLRKYSSLLSLIPVLLTLSWIYYAKLISMGCSPFEYNLDFISRGLDFILINLLQGWAEFAIAYPLAFFGFLYSLRSERNKDIFILTLPMILALSGVYGFLLNGAFERYTMIPLAMMCITAGKPIAEFMDKHGMKMKHLLAFLIAHLLVLNAGVLLISETGANSIYDFGFWYDVEVVNILNEKASNEFVVGTPHGAFVNAEWKYAERRISEAIALDPDWLVTFKAWVEVKPNDKLEIYEVGPYILIHSHPRGFIDEFVEAKDFGFNKLRG